MSITAIPDWVNISFAILFLTVPTILLGYYFTRDYLKISEDKARRLRIGIIVFVSVFLLLIGTLSLTGFYAINGLPPRILLFGAIPLLLSYSVFFRIQRFREAFNAIRLESLISIHLFRFVGVYFFVAYYFGALPRQFAFIGGGGDILTAILVFPVVFALKKQWKYAVTLVIIWNIIGLLDILSVLGNAIYFTQIALEGQGNGVIEFATFPFSWIPAFAPATIIFLHVLIFIKLRNHQKTVS